MKNKFLILSIFIVIAIILLVFTISYFLGDKSIVGSWSYEQGGTRYTYIFNEDKTGTYEVSGSIMNFTYEDTGDSILIHFYGDTASNQLEYRIEGNSLIIKTSIGKETIYTRDK